MSEKSHCINVLEGSILTKDNTSQGMEKRCILEIVEVVLLELLSVNEVLLLARSWRQESDKAMEHKVEDHLGSKDHEPVVIVNAFVVIVYHASLEPVIV